MSRVPFYADTDPLLAGIERVMLRGQGGRRIPDRLWDRLGELADRVGHGPNPPETYREAHGYVFELQRRAQQRVQIGPPRPRRTAGHGSARSRAQSRYHAARVPESVRWDPEWAWYAWQAAADDAKCWPSGERVGIARAAWSHYWEVIQAAADPLERAA